MVRGCNFTPLHTCSSVYDCDAKQPPPPCFQQFQAGWHFVQHRTIWYVRVAFVINSGRMSSSLFSRVQQCPQLLWALDQDSWVVDEAQLMARDIVRAVL